MAIIGYKAFTRKYDSVVQDITTECQISRAFDPHKTPKAHIPKMTNCKALWDTGATNTVISRDMAIKLGLIATSFAKSYHAQGYTDNIPIYYINICLPNGVSFSTLKVSEGILVGTDVLIGMDIIKRGYFCICQKDNKTTFTFQIPSSHDFDFTLEKNEPITAPKQQGRNDLCSCGSGKKYKYCCGN